MHVIVETARGVELGTVMIPTREVNDDSVIQPLKPVIRIATEADEKTALKNREKEKEAFEICLEKIAKHKLDMKLVEAEYTFDNNKLLFCHLDGYWDKLGKIGMTAKFSSTDSNPTHDLCLITDSDLAQLD